jgi:hypothetical protein
MATSTYLSNPDVLFGAVNLSDQCTSVQLNQTLEALESTAFGGSARVYTAGLQNNELTITMYASYAASESYATLSTLVGTQIATIIVSPAAPSTPGTYSATNPGFTLSGRLFRNATCHERIAGHLGHHGYCYPWRCLNRRRILKTTNPKGSPTCSYGLKYNAQTKMPTR